MTRQESDGSPYRDDLAGDDLAGAIALVGMSGRFPGAADVAEFWRNLRAGRDCISRFTETELRDAGVAADLLADPRDVKAGAVIEGIDLFDAAFFCYTPREAQVLDPQQRLFLEHSWAALEDAGCDPAQEIGRVGVFAGAGLSTYLLNNLATRPDIVAAVGQIQLALANDKDSLATRAAYALNLRGPAVGIQTYCSASLVAVCTACTSLAAGECDVALAGGVAVSVPQRVRRRRQGHPRR